MLQTLISKLEDHRVLIRALSVPLIVLLIPAVAWFVYSTGGIKFVYSHSMYVPIVLSALVFGTPTAIIVALVAGLALGPYMPVDVATGEMQETINWLYRTGFFVLIATIVGMASDLIRLYIRRIRWRLFHDPQTDLPNRTALLNDLEHNLNPTTGNGETSRQALILLSLTDLQDYELRLGSHFGASIIQQLASSFREQLPDSIEMYQTTANHIALLIPDEETTPIATVARQLERTFSQPCHFEGIPVILNHAVGVVRTDELVLDRAEEYLQKADICIAEARRSKTRQVHYKKDLDAASRQNIELLGNFKNAFDSGRLFLHYQPKVTLSDREICGCEALLRWQSADGQFIAPDFFIPRVEQSGLIHALSHWVIEQGLLQLKQWQQQGAFVGPVALNISPRNLLADNFVDDLLQMLERYDMPASSIELEVTESAFMDDIKQTARKLKKLSRMGVGVAIDDFGTGYSSLQYLDRLPADTVKLDRVFVQRLDRESGRRHMVEHTIRLAHSLGMRITAEGVESEAVACMLQDMGCEMAQGFHFSRPLSAGAFQQYCQAA